MEKGFCTIYAEPDRFPIVRQIIDMCKILDIGYEYRDIPHKTTDIYKPRMPIKYLLIFMIGHTKIHTNARDIYWLSGSHQWSPSLEHVARQVDAPTVTIISQCRSLQRTFDVQGTIDTPLHRTRSIRYAHTQDSCYQHEEYTDPFISAIIHTIKTKPDITIDEMVQTVNRALYYDNNPYIPTYTHTNDPIKTLQ
jgi:hypothetical protein